MLNMGQLTQYPRDPNAFVPLRGGSHDTPLTVIGHEAGHLFLALASIADPNDPSARPMLGYGLPHHLRITVGTAPENERLVAAVRDML